MKRLTNSDLNRTGTSHQTHIGLCDSSLTSMGSRKRKYSSMLIHEDKIYLEPCAIGKIKRKNGKRECTKVTMGDERNSENLVRRIRELASNRERNYYMIWFASDTNVPVFILLEEGSDRYNRLNNAFRFESIPNNKIRTWFIGANEVSDIL